MSGGFYDARNLDHDPALAQALGNMVVAWANAETALFFALSIISGMPINMAVAAYFRIPTFEARIKMMMAIVEEWETPTHPKETVTEAIEKLGKLAAARNHWVHGAWCVDRPHTQTVIFDYRAPAKSPHRRRPVKAADVLNHIEAVHRRAQALNTLFPPW